MHFSYRLPRAARTFAGAAFAVFFAASSGLARAQAGDCEGSPCDSFRGLAVPRESPSETPQAETPPAEAPNAETPQAEAATETAPIPADESSAAIPARITIAPATTPRRAPPRGAPPRTPAPSQVPPGSPQPLAVVYPTLVPTTSQPVVEESLGRPEDPERERFAVAVDGGLRVYRGATGAYTFRVRIGRKHLYFDYRLVTTKVAGVFEGDSARITETTYGLGIRHRFRITDRSTLSIGAGGGVGWSRATGDSSSGNDSTFVTRAAELRLEVVYEFARRALRFRVGLEAGQTWGIRVQSAAATGGTVEIGAFDGLGAGLHLGIGLARLRGRYGR